MGELYHDTHLGDKSGSFAAGAGRKMTNASCLS
jgi:hypothetical protein